MNQNTIQSIAESLSEVRSIEEAQALEEAKFKVGTRVKIVGGHKDRIGKTGYVREIRHGLHKTSPKTYSIYHDDGSWTDAQKEHLRIE